QGAPLLSSGRRGGERRAERHVPVRRHGQNGRKALPRGLCLPGPEEGPQKKAAHSQ
ncbi:hypothetical protein NHX12_023546, partial [Muraenolepis orangiensis]